MRHNVYVCERVCVRVREIERVCASTYLLGRACVCVCVRELERECAIRQTIF